MPKVFIAVLCDDVRHEFNNKFSLMGIFSRWNVVDFTKPLPPFHVFARIGFEAEGDHPIEVELRTAEGERRFLMQGVAHLEGKDEVTDLYLTNIEFKLENLMIPRPGNYEFAIRSGGE